MKRHFISFMVALMALTTSLSFAQTKTDTTKHLKKDGTVDKRYKTTSTSSKVSGSKSSTTQTDTAKHLKKDGTPDMRYKSNNPNAGKKKTTTTSKM